MTTEEQFNEKLRWYATCAIACGGTFGIGIMIGSAVQEGQSKREWEAKAVVHRAGTYVADQQGKSVFRWKDEP